jgi:hypothetical protein
MTPPEVVLDRAVRACLRREPGCDGYRGKLDIETIQSPSFRSFLYLVQASMNEALRLEGPNASGGVTHPPFHFDYIAVEDRTENAHAFEHGGFLFIVLTLPMVESIWHTSQRLSRLPTVHRLLGVHERVNLDVLHGLLFQIETNFLIGHEYRHHIYNHFTRRFDEHEEISTEFPAKIADGNLEAQAQELDADGFAVYLALAHLIRSARRDGALAILNGGVASNSGDELLLECLLIAILALYVRFWHVALDVAALHRATHPPPPVRVKYLFLCARMWCGQNRSLPEAWFSTGRLQDLLRVATEMVPASAKESWEQQIAHLTSPDGVAYDQQLFDEFEKVRRNGPG